MVHSKNSITLRLRVSIGAGILFALVGSDVWPQALLPSPAGGQGNAASTPFGLKAIFDAAWLRQPEARSLAARTDAATARREAVNSWTPEPAALSFRQKPMGRAAIRGGVNLPPVSPLRCGCRMNVRDRGHSPMRNR